MACHKPAVLFSHAAIVDFIQSFWTFLLSRVNTRLQQEDQATAQIVQRSAPASALAALTNNGENEELLEVTANMLVELLQVRFVRMLVRVHAQDAKLANRLTFAFAAPMQLSLQNLTDLYQKVLPTMLNDQQRIDIIA